MFKESVVLAINALLGNKLRSLLTMLGIIIGVGAVIAMISIGMGVRDKVQNSISGLGSNLIMVSPGAARTAGVRQAAGSTITLTLKDAQAIARDVSGVNAVAPTVSRSFQLIAGNQNWNTQVQGTTPEFLQVRNMDVESGSFFTQQAVAARERVAVIGSTVAQSLFPDSDPIGQMIRVDKSPFRVIGVLSSKGQSAGGGDQDDLVLVPVTTAQERLLGITYVHLINIQATSEDVIYQVQDEISALLRARHNLTSAQEDDFTVRNLVSVMETAAEATGTITLLLGNIAAISLLVGGIGIMNIMLVSVTERTREIGIRKALGAKYRDILLQFLIESVVIGVLGGALGILLGIGAASAIATLSEWDTVISPLSIIAAFVFSIAIGVFFGIYPARKAALLDPIVALRYE